MKKICLSLFMLAVCLYLSAGCKENKEKSKQIVRITEQQSEKPVPPEHEEEPELAGLEERLESSITLDTEKKTRKEIFRNTSGYPVKVVLDEFNDEGLIIKTTEKNGQGYIVNQEELSYDKDGNLIKRVVLDGKYKGLVYTYKIIAKNHLGHWTKREEYTSGKLRYTEVRMLEYVEGDTIPRVVELKRIEP